MRFVTQVRKNGNFDEKSRRQGSPPAVGAFAGTVQAGECAGDFVEAESRGLLAELAQRNRRGLAARLQSWRISAGDRDSGKLAQILGLGYHGVEVFEDLGDGHGVDFAAGVVAFFNDLL